MPNFSSNRRSDSMRIGCVSEQDENRGQREGERRRPYRKKKSQSSPRTCFWVDLSSALAERRDTLAVSCSPGLAAHLSRRSFLAGAAIFISSMETFRWKKQNNGGEGIEELYSTVWLSVVAIFNNCSYASCFRERLNYIRQKNNCYTSHFKTFKPQNALSPVIKVYLKLF